MGIVVVQSFGICVVVHGVFVAKTFVFYLLFFAVEVLIMSCLHRQNSAQCKFRRWAIFSHVGLLQKLQKLLSFTRQTVL